MQIINLNGRPLAVGLTWRPLQSDMSEEEEVKALARTENTRIGYVARNAEEGLVLVGFADPRTRRGIACGAAWLAKAVDPKEHLLLIEPLGAHTWVCVVSRGVPLPGFDQVVANDALQECLSTLPGDRTFRIVTSLELVEGREEGSFAQLVEGVKPEVLSQVSGLPPVYWIVAGALATCAVLGVGTGMALSYAKERRVSSAQQLAVAQQRNAQVALAAQQRDEAAGRAMAIVEEQVTGRPGAKETIDAWVDVIERLPTSVMGWKLHGAVCTDDACVVTFDRTKYGTSLSFKQACDAHGWAMVVLKGNQAAVRFPAPMTARSSSPSQLPGTADALLGLSTELQRLELAGLTFQLGDPQQVTAPLVPADPKVPSTAPGNEVFESPYFLGKIALAGKQMFEIRDAIAYLEPVAVAPVKLVYDYDGSTWAMEINYASQ
jgi:pilin accessory protein (PilO)